MKDLLLLLNEVTVLLIVVCCLHSDMKEVLLHLQVSEDKDVNFFPSKFMDP